MRGHWINLAIWTSLTLHGAIAAHPAVATEAKAHLDNRWSGAYAGANLGYHAINTSGIFDGVEPAGTPDLSNIGGTSANLGIQAGYGWQWDRLVLGVEADVSWGGFAKSYTTIQDGGPTEAGLFSYPIVGDLAYLATLRARAGFHATLGSHDWLLFATGGAAFTRFNMDIASGRGRVDFDALGTVVGGGVEVALSDRSSLRAEYLHHAFGKQVDFSDVNTSGVFDANDGNYVRLNTVDVVRIAWNFKLN